MLPVARGSSLVSLRPCPSAAPPMPALPASAAPASCRLTTAPASELGGRSSEWEAWKASGEAGGCGGGRRPHFQQAPTPAIIPAHPRARPTPHPASQGPPASLPGAPPPPPRLGRPLARPPAPTSSSALPTRCDARGSAGAFGRSPGRPGSLGGAPGMPHGARGPGAAAWAAPVPATRPPRSPAAAAALPPLVAARPPVCRTLAPALPARQAAQRMAR